MYLTTRNIYDGYRQTVLRQFLQLPFAPGLFSLLPLIHFVLQGVRLYTASDVFGLEQIPVKLQDLNQHQELY